MLTIRAGKKNNKLKLKFIALRKLKININFIPISQQGRMSHYKFGFKNKYNKKHRQVNETEFGNSK